VPSLFRSSLVYLVLNGISAFIPFLLIPFYTTYLTPTDFGYFTSFQILTGLVSPFISFGLISYIEVTQQTFPEDDKKNIVIISTIIFFINSFFIFLLFFPLKNIISSYIPVNWLIITSIMVVPLSQNISQIILTIYQMKNKVIEYLKFSLFNLFLTTTLSITLIYFINASWQGRVMGMLISSIFLIIITLILMFRYIENIKINVSYLNIKRMLKFGFPLVLSNIFGFLLLMIDRTILFAKIGPNDTGLYSLGFQISQIVLMSLLSANTAFVPWLYSQLKLNNYLRNEQVVKWSYLFILISILFSLVFGIIAPYFLKYFINESFYGAFKFILILSLAQGVRSIYFVAINYISYSGKTKFILYSMLISLCIYIPLAYFFIDYFKSTGAAYSVLLSNLFSSLIVFHFSRKAYKMPWFNFKLFK